MATDAARATGLPSQGQRDARPGEMTAAEVLAIAGLQVVSEDDSVFFYDLFIAAADIPPKPREMPPQQWQAALKRRTLTGEEQAARERYFERKIQESTRKRAAATQ